MRQAVLLRIGVLACCGLTTTASPQHAPSPERAFRDAVMHKQLYLRNFSAEEKVQATWDGGSLHMQGPRYHAVAAFLATSVEVSNNRVRLHGSLQLVMRSNATQIVLGAEMMPILITVDLPAGDAAGVLPRLRDALFYKDFLDADRNLPEMLRTQLPANADSHRAKASASSPPCDCADTTPACAGKTQEAASPGWKNPRVLTTADPELPHHPGFRAAAATMVLEVNDRGTLDGVWLATQSDEEVGRASALAASKYTFTPASCHDVPAPMVLWINTNIN